MKPDPFERRIEILGKSMSTPRSEIDAAVLTYERLRTAVAACSTEFGELPPIEAVLAVFAELCRAAQSGQDSRTVE